MGFKSNLGNVLSELDASKKETLTAIGNFITTEAQLREPVGKREDGDPDPGLMKRSTTYQVPNNNEVDIGVTKEAVNKKGKPYAIYVEKGTSKMAAQPFLQPAVMDNISKIGEIAGLKFSVHMGDK